MSILDDEKRDSSSGDGVPKVKVTPPPPPPTTQLFLSILFGVLGFGAAYFRSWTLCTISTALIVLASIAAVVGLRAWQGKMGWAMGDGVPILRVPPPPPPPVQRILLILSPVLALAAVLFRSWGLSLTFTALTVALDLAVLASVRAWTRNAEKAIAGQSGVA